ncbi:MAG TPA: TCP-1/cpn60 chaperonin family protein, partial [Candidatus Gracilibacteria bacterium]|nr:TCP-1/cpn60 chaperonin family protein [Candidatus Gracilibacteria bacterium]
FGDRRKEMLKDIAVLTGATVISDELGLDFEKARPEHLGRAAKVVATKDTTTIVDGKGDPQLIENRVSQIKREYELAKSDYDKEKLAERIAKLTGGVAIIKVGAASELEQKEKKMRIEDALAATRAAIAEGIVAGGGTALIAIAQRLKKAIKEEKDPEVALGMEVVSSACSSPLKQIAQNSGFSGEVVLDAVNKNLVNSKEFGFDASQLVGDEIKIENLVQKGIVDPKKVVRVALENAASVAGIFLTTEAAIADLPKKEEPAMPNMGGMGMDY